MDNVGLSRLDLTDEVRVELLRRAVSLITECRDCEPAMAYLKDVEQRLTETRTVGVDDLPSMDGFIPQS